MNTQDTQDQTIPRKPVDWRYLAGLFDGEGTVCIRKGHQRPKTRPYSLSQYRLFVGFTMCDGEAIIDLKETWGGRYSFVPSKNPKWRGAFHWQVDGPKAYEFLKGIFPYIKLARKRRAVALAFKFGEIQKQGFRNKDEHRFNLMVEVWQQIKEANHRGGPAQDSVETARAALINDEVKIQSEHDGDIVKTAAKAASALT